MKHLLMVAIGCASVTTLITATPARSQPTKSSCPPPYVWIDVNKLPIAIRPKYTPNGKVKLLSSPCSEGPPPRSLKRKPIYLDEYDGLRCDPKTGRCRRIPADPSYIPPGVLPRRSNPPEIRVAPSTQSKRLRPPASLQQTSKDIRPHQQRSTFDGIFAPNDLRVVDNTKVKPWSPRTKIYSLFSDLQVKECSGTLVGSRHVMTAAHCVWNPKSETDPLVFEIPQKIQVIPGLNETNKPYGEFVFTPTRDSIINPPGYQSYYNPTNPIPSYPYDIAIIVLNQTVGDPPGWLTFTNLSNPIGEKASLAGYPNDTSALSSKSTSLLTASGKYVKFYDASDPLLPRVVVHKIDGVSGMSGSSMTTNINSNATDVITGLFLGSSKDKKDVQWNIALALDQVIVSQLKLWITSTSTP